MARLGLGIGRVPHGLGRAPCWRLRAPPPHLLAAEEMKRVGMCQVTASEL